MSIAITTAQQSGEPERPVSPEPDSARSHPGRGKRTGRGEEAGDDADADADEIGDPLDDPVYYEGMEADDTIRVESESDTDTEDSKGPADGKRKPPPKPSESLASPLPYPEDPMLAESNTSRMAIIVPRNERTTSNRLQASEYSYVLSVRSSQIAKNPTVFTDIGGLIHPDAIAQKELLDRKCPLVLERFVGYAPSGERMVEEWLVREMALPPIPTLSALKGLASSPASR